MKSQSVMISATDQVFNEAPGLSFGYFIPKLALSSLERKLIYSLILLPLQLLKIFLRLDLMKLISCYKYYLQRKVLEMVKDGSKEIMRYCVNLNYVTQILVRKLRTFILF